MTFPTSANSFGSDPCEDSCAVSSEMDRPCEDTIETCAVDVPAATQEAEELEKAPS